ncbi:MULTISPECIES: HIT family protein [Desulfococcus]|jgi:histidine triad (HIT) family protein|uniref:Histidine triad (HIT) protein n=1 Tax=Desulfococcus multivorans DSM 2059 TaxID=1121405 RepID=S7UPH1_DESML|nr:HIT family protein [Desulfococcus multivorans]AOY59557.1 histidine triad (HIT) family protein [Desulfococcus multivorans]AQV01748.1 histidine triad (HIT) protein [Desulfococcus multivorans]EPR34203.1 histidine triad (HIT) protein [Desulfococcus multivorans DSM 2059]MDX9819745.1 HIT family protein [Desulfococcus multivorans]SKA20094.1 histidine triad (HIT) family protein [Desulfococcus multivorans DSM 2059]
MEDCIFCRIIRGEIPSIKVYEDESVFAFMDINPISTGHTLVIPKAHAGNIWEIASEDLSALHIASKTIAHALKRALDPDGIACLQLNGEAVGQVVMHYHFHLVPRIKGAPPLPVTQWELKSGNMDEIKSVAQRITAALQ